MKLQAMFVFSLRALLALLLLPFSASRTLAAPVQTRASHLGALAVGMGKLLHMADYLQEYPGSRTAILVYLTIDSKEASSLLKDLRTQATIQASMGRDFWPQIALETGALDLVGFRRELARRDSLVARNVRTLAQEIARYRDQDKWYFIRPFSEMNDGTTSAPWELGNRAHHNTPSDFAQAWKLLRNTFDQEGATNAVFVFSPLAASGMDREGEVLATLNQIPAGFIDAFGLNLYSRPRTAYGGSSPEPIPFATLAQP